MMPESLLEALIGYSAIVYSEHHDMWHLGQEPDTQTAAENKTIS